MTERRLHASSECLARIDENQARYQPDCDSTSSPRRRPRPSSSGSRPRSARTTSATTRRTRRPSRTPTMTRCASATRRSRRGFPTWCARIRRRAGSAPRRAEFAKVRHAVPMLSLDNAFCDEEVIEFVDRMRRFLRLPEEEKRRFHRRAEDRRPVAVAALRGRPAGAAARPAATAPKARTSPPTCGRSRHSAASCAASDVPDVCEVRGEVYMTKTAFLALNERQKAAGRADLRQSAQLGGGLAAPEGSGDHGVAPARLLRL